METKGMNPGCVEGGIVELGNNGPNKAFDLEKEDDHRRVWTKAHSPPIDILIVQ